MLPSIRFVWPSCCDCFERTGVGAYRIRPPWRRGCMFDGGDVFADIMWNHPVQASCYPWNDRTGVGVYRIRPPRRRCCIFDGGDVFAVIISFSPIWGRMRYAPTPVRLIFGIYWVCGWFHFRPREGVCDTPLHLFDCYRGWIWFTFTPVRFLSGLTLY